MKDIENIINQAILNEVEGAQFYRMAASQNANPEAIEALNKLAEEEVAHIEYLRQFSKEVAGGTITVDGALSANVPSPEIYSWGKRDKQNVNLSLSVACKWNATPSLSMKALKNRWMIHRRKKSLMN